MINKKHVYRFCGGLLAVVMMCSGCGVIVEGPMTSVVEETSEDSDFISVEEKEIRPQDDFYGYRNAKDLAQISVKYGESYGGPMADVMKEVDEELLQIVKDVAGSELVYPEGSKEQIIRDAYKQYMEYFFGSDTGETESTQSSVKNHFQDLVLQIENSTDCRSLLQAIGDICKETGEGVFFEVQVGRNYLAGDEHALFMIQKTGFGDIELKDIYEDDTIRENIYDFAVDTLLAFGEENEDADRKARDLVYLLLEIANHTDFDIMNTDNMYATLQNCPDDEMAKLLGNVGLQELYESYGITSNPYGCWLIQDKEQICILNELFCNEHLETLKTYCKVELMSRYRNLLSKEYPFLEVYEQQSTKSKEALAVEYVTLTFEQEVSTLYTEQCYAEEMNQKLKELFDEIVEGYGTLIDSADWLSHETRVSLHQKLDNIIMFDYITAANRFSTGTGLIGTDPLDTYFRSRSREYDKMLQDIGTPYNRETEYEGSSFTVNAFYNSSNAIYVTPGIMHAPYFDCNASHGTNLGGLGMVVAHEIGHAFDSLGIDFDANNQLRPEWIGQEDREIMMKRNKVMEEHFSRYVILDVYHVNGTQTLFENCADQSAMECLMKIAVSKEEQREVFENYGCIWSNMIEDKEAITQLQLDEHSPEIIRVNGVLSDTDEFYEVYDVKPGDGMYLAPEARAYRWK